MSDWRKEVKTDSPFLYHYDIEGLTPLAVTIERFEHIEAFCPGKKAKGMLWCLHFKGGKKALGVNVTNGNLIESMHGPDPAGWVGKRIVLRIAECDGDKCIRIHAPGCKLPAQCKKFRYLDAAPKIGPARPETAANDPDVERQVKEVL